MSKELANKLKVLRASMNVTQEIIGSKLSVDRSTYSNYERGITEPDIKTLIKLADIFNVTVDFLLGRGEESTKVADSGGTPVYTLSKEEKDFVISLRIMDKEKRSRTKSMMDEILKEDETK